ncbi:MAG TPA: ATP-binding protein, partial [Desulfuromonadaceae bacterium]|nr:ATP-binding protein [Desulfuromonadaceae bacterium]
GVRANFDMIRRNVELEARLIDDLLDLSRITSGKLKLEKRSVNVHGILKTTLAMLQSEIEQREITLVQKFDAFQNIISGDTVRLQQIFWNILKNAMKFTPPRGTITVATRSAGEEYIITVSDTGIGMTAQELARAFNAFTQGDHSEDSRRFGGLGLGLTISKKLIELHGGRIEAASEGRNRGSTFVMRFPLADWAERPPKADPLPATGSAIKLTGLNILLVEDHEPTRSALAGLLISRRHKVTMAVSIREAVALAARNHFDLVISDIGLPDGNGYDLFKKLKKLSPLLKGIALTGYGTDDDLARSKDSGFHTHLTKPVRIQSLEAALAESLAN